MSFNYETPPRFYRAAWAGLAAVATGRRTKDQFFEWLGKVRVDGALLPRPHGDTLMGLARAAARAGKDTEGDS